MKVQRPWVALEWGHWCERGQMGMRFNDEIYSKFKAGSVLVPGDRWGHTQVPDGWEGRKGLVNQRGGGCRSDQGSAVRGPSPGGRYWAHPQEGAPTPEHPKVWARQEQDPKCTKRWTSGMYLDCTNNRFLGIEVLEKAQKKQRNSHF